MKKIIYGLMLMSLTACAETNTSNVSKVKTEPARTAKSKAESTDITKEFVLKELTRNLKAKNLKYDTETQQKVLISDVNGDNLKDAVVTFWIDDPEAHRNFGKSAIYEVWKIAILINEDNKLNITELKPFTDLVPLGTNDQHSDEKLKGNTYSVTYERNKQFDDNFNSDNGWFEKKPMEFSIINGKFVLGKVAIANKNSNTQENVTKSTANNATLKITPFQDISHEPGFSVFYQNGKALFYFDENTKKGKIVLDDNSYDLAYFDKDGDYFSIGGTYVDVEPTKFDYTEGGADCSTWKAKSLIIFAKGKQLTLNSVTLSYCP